MPTRVIVADVYPAGEAPIAGADRDSLVAGDARARPPPCRWRWGARQSSPAWCSDIARPGDYVVCLGAGSITQWAYALPGELAALGKEGMARSKRPLQVTNAVAGNR